MNLTSKTGLIARLKRGNAARQRFSESHVDKTIAHQIRAIRDSLGWSQERLAEEVGMNQNAISRLESPDYGKPTISTLKRLAAAFDVSLIVRFAPFSEIVDWVSGTPRLNEGLTTESLAVPTFAQEEAQGVFSESLSALPINFAEMMRGADSASARQQVEMTSFHSTGQLIKQINSEAPWNYRQFFSREQAHSLNLQP
jgi:transcriptional regulator with XRE-family HTH domain